MSKNIISISQLCHDNNISIVFSSTSFHMKDLKTEESLFQGLVATGIYQLKSTTPIVYASINSSLDCYYCLGHSSRNVFRQIVSKNKFHVPSISNSSIVSIAPVEYVYSDLWISPIYSHDGFKYCLIFLIIFLNIFGCIIWNENQMQNMYSFDINH